MVMLGKSEDIPRLKGSIIAALCLDTDPLGMQISQMYRQGWGTGS